MGNAREGTSIGCAVRCVYPLQGSLHHPCLVHRLVILRLPTEYNHAQSNLGVEHK